MLSKGQEMVARLEPGQSQSQRERACLAVQPSLGDYEQLGPALSWNLC